MSQDKRIVVTGNEVAAMLGADSFRLPAAIRERFVTELNKKLNPPAWKVLAETGRTTPRIRFRDTGIQLHVYVSDPAFGANRDTARTLKIADLVAECLNARGLEVE